MNASAPIPPADSLPEHAAPPGAPDRTTSVPARPGPSAAAQAASRPGATPAAVARGRRSGKATTAGEKALAWAHSARFVTTATHLGQLAVDGPAEIAFVGRSNAGKSTAINTLAQQRQLAYASRTPGRTQHINLFEVGSGGPAQVYWADLPGYGYAAVDKQSKKRWQMAMSEYLAERPQLGGIVMLVDSRLGLTPLDQLLLEFVAPRVDTGEVRLLVVLTKADKLSRKEQAAALARVQAHLQEQVGPEADVSMALFSALSRQGLEDVAECLMGWAQEWADAAAATAGGAAQLAPGGVPGSASAATTSSAASPAKA